MFSQQTFIHGSIVQKVLCKVNTGLNEPPLPPTALSHTSSNAKRNTQHIPEELPQGCAYVLGGARGVGAGACT